MSDSEVDSGPLRGIIVADFTRIISGPLVTQILGDLGAHVVKVEALGLGDQVRDYRGGIGPDGISPIFLAFNRNKQSIAVDLQKPSGLEIARRLIERADVLVENFRPGVMARLGLDYESVSKLNPRLIYCSISGFGDTGPLRSKGAVDVVIQAYSGIMSMTGELGRSPVRCGIAVSDMSSGIYGATGVLAALFERSRSGRGQLVRTSLVESALSLINYQLIAYWQYGFVHGLQGTGSQTSFPNEAFEALDGRVVIAAATDSMWHRLCTALGLEELISDPRFASLVAREANRVELSEQLARVIGSMSVAECTSLLDDAGVVCAPINTIDRIADDPHAKELGIFAEVGSEDLGNVSMVASPLRLARTPTSIRLPPPRHGEHTDEVLRDIGYDTSAIESLHLNGIVE